MATKDISDLQVCEAVRASRESRFLHWPYDFLQHWTRQPFKVCWRAMERAARRGLIEYGVSLRTAWLTQKGLDLLKGNCNP